MKIQRYDDIVNCGEFEGMELTDDGEWYKVSDVDPIIEALEKERDELLKIVTTLRFEIDAEYNRIRSDWPEDYLTLFVRRLKAASQART